MSTGINAAATQAMVDASIAMQVKEAQSLVKGIQHLRTKACLRMKPILARLMDIFDSLKPFEDRARSTYSKEFIEVAQIMKDAADELERVKAFTQGVNTPTPQPIISAQPQPVVFNAQAEPILTNPVKQPEIVQTNPVKQPEIAKEKTTGEQIADVADKTIQAVNAIKAIKAAVEAVKLAW